jgi:hypothetical protein
MIPVVMEPRCRAPGSWPGGTVKGKIGSKLNIDLSDDATFDAGTMAHLIREIAAVTGKVPAARVPEVEGLAALLASCKLENLLDTATRWCDEQGYRSVTEIKECGDEDELLRMLQLKPGMQKMVYKRLGAFTS